MKMSTTQTFTARVDVSISDFEVNDIIDYLQDECFLNEDQYNRLREIAEANLNDISDVIIKPKTLADKIKLDLITEVFDKYSLEELTRRLS
jgi:SOS response regulatory protein OraA/RecX